MPRYAYCVSCQAGDEASVAKSISRRFKLQAIYPALEREEHRGAKWSKVTVPLLKGYVFIYNEEPYPMEKVRQLAKVTRVLQYTNGEYALTGNDFEFADWVYRHKGIIGISRAMLVGARTVIIDGPLKDFEGVIKKIDRQSRNAMIEISVGDTVKNVWLGFKWMTIKNGQLVNWEKKDHA